jgi:hypothetical protein
MEVNIYKVYRGGIERGMAVNIFKGHREVLREGIPGS